MLILHISRLPLNILKPNRNTWMQTHILYSLLYLSSLMILLKSFSSFNSSPFHLYFSVILSFLYIFVLIVSFLFLDIIGSNMHTNTSIITISLHVSVCNSFLFLRLSSHCNKSLLFLRYKVSHFTFKSLLLSTLTLKKRNNNH